jgi:hypothetical protein
MAAPFIILAPHRSFTSVTCAMLGQHPQMFGLPEMNLFVAENMWEWWILHDEARRPLAHGLLRAVAQLCFGEQTRGTIEFARQWLRRRLHRTTADVFRELAGMVDSSFVIDKSPFTAFRFEYLDRLHREFPEARFLHLVRHPREQGRSMITLLLELGTDPMQLDRWLSAGNNPQDVWYFVNRQIRDFLAPLPPAQWMRVRGEDLLATPDAHLQDIAKWLGVRTDDEAIDQMKHPEESPFACFGPPGARLGYDPHFLRNPFFRPKDVEFQSLEGSLDWRRDTLEFSPQVKRLARTFGYE